MSVAPTQPAADWSLSSPKDDTLPQKMEALAAVSLAGNILQFIQFGRTVCSAVVEYRNSTTGLLHSHEALDNGISDLNKLLLKLSRGYTSEANAENVDDSDLQDRVVDCLAVGEEMRLKLSRFRDKKKRGLRGHLLVLQMIWSGPELERLEQQLDQIKSRIHLQIDLDQRQTLKKITSGHTTGQEKIYAHMDHVAKNICDNIFQGRETLLIDQAVMSAQLHDLHLETEDMISSRLDSLHLAMESGLQQMQALIEMQPPCRSASKRSRRHVNRTPCLLIPFKRNPNFVERGDMMKLLFRNSKAPESAIAITGFGGAGKTELAVEFAYLYHELFPDTWIFWIGASSYNRLQESLAEAAHILGLTKRSEIQRKSSEKFKDWLKHTHDDWYLFFDNTDDLGSLKPRCDRLSTEQNHLQLLELHSPRGRTLYTTRSRSVALRLVQQDASNVLTLEQMSKPEALGFLTKQLCYSVNTHEALELAQALEFIPLALSHAAAYLNLRSSVGGIKQYLCLLKNEKSKAMQLEHESLARSILLAWHISFDKIEKQRPSAAYLLAFLSHCHWHAVPDSLLQAYARWTRHFHPEKPENRIWNDITTLVDYHFVREGQNDGLYSIHPLVHLAMRRWIEQKGSQSTQLEHFINVTTAELPTEVFKAHRESRDTRRHVDYAFTNTPPANSNLDEAWAELLTRVGHLSCLEGAYETARLRSQWALEKRRRMYGHADPRTLASWRVYIRALRHLFELEESLAETDNCLQAHLELHGPHHQDTYTVQSNLAALQHLRGQYTECEATMRTILNGRRTILGEFHPETFETKVNLTMSLIKAEKLDEAEQTCRAIRPHIIDVFGYDHDAFTVNLKNLASILRTKGQLAEAEEVLVEAGAKSSAVLGEIDAKTVTVMNELALVLCEQRKFDEALKINETVFERHCKLYGEDHPWTMIALNSKALTLKGQGRISEARGVFEKVIARLSASFGPAHPQTRRIKDNLLNLEQGKICGCDETVGDQTGKR